MTTGRGRETFIDYLEKAVSEKLTFTHKESTLR